jgi:single-strand DNA-binding protein
MDCNMTTRPEEKADMSTSSMTTTATDTPARYGSRFGNLTRDPELRYSAKGSAWASCGLAVTPRRRTDDGSFEDLPPEFYDLVCFGDLAEHVAECLHKGDRVVAVGRIEEEHWTGKDGAERTTTKLVAEEVGPSLRFATVHVERVERRGPAAPGAGYGFSQEPF